MGKLTRSRARALVGLGRFEEARDAIVDGLQFEPDEKVRLVNPLTSTLPLADRKDLNNYLVDVEELIRRQDAGEALDDEAAQQDAKWNPVAGAVPGVPSSEAATPSSNPTSGTASPTKAPVVETKA